ncbi:MAG: hypothetical protein MZV70_18890 [Desulfobacterales bacterium]|nr:hypothetical protein [Desulfobacterales bacterium]
MRQNIRRRSRAVKFQQPEPASCGRCGGTPYRRACDVGIPHAGGPE